MPVSSLMNIELTPEEQAELEKIPREIPAATRRHYKRLTRKRQTQTLTKEEQKELVRLSEWMEGVEVKRLEYLSKLAHKRGCKLSELIEALKLPTPSYA